MAYIWLTIAVPFAAVMADWITLDQIITNKE